MKWKNILGRPSNDFQNTDQESQLNIWYLPANGPRKILAEVTNTFLTVLWSSFLAWYVSPKVITNLKNTKYVPLMPSSNT